MKMNLYLWLMNTYRNGRLFAFVLTRQFGTAIVSSYTMCICCRSFMNKIDRAHFRSNIINNIDFN